MFYCYAIRVETQLETFEDFGGIEILCMEMDEAGKKLCTAFEDVGVM